ncbi:MAG: AraC family transcriptional regulator [Paludibacteraceae bacterium]|nr:AraC family transcriptional regulator [Paludibacteraceae bacterium]
MELYGKLFWLYTLCVAISAVFLFAAVLIVMRNEGSRSKRVLGLTLLVWAMVLFTPNYFAQTDLIDSGFVRYKMLLVVGCSMGTMISLLYPLLLINPRSFGIRNYIGHCGIPLLLLLSYLIHLSVTDCSLLDPMEHDMFAEGVGCQEVFYLLFTGYMLIEIVYVWFMVHSFLPIYNKMLDESYSNTEVYDIRWLHFFIYPSIMLVSCFILFTLTQLYVFALLHCFLIGAWGVASFCRALFSDTYDLEQYLPLQWSIRYSKWVVLKEDRIVMAEEMDQPVPGVQLLTAQQVEAYKNLFEEWMHVTKPYKSPNFRVADVQKKLGIGRLETNELFNRAYGIYFRNLVQRYRIDEAVRMIGENPDRQIKEVAFEVGFSSQAVFARSFQIQMGKSCTQYRKENAL